MVCDETVCDLTRDAAAATVRPLVKLLRQVAHVVERLSDSQYAGRPVGPVDGSIGGHVRHCLDHVQALIEAAQTGALDYDHRTRDARIEKSRSLALARIGQLQRRLTELPGDVMDRRLAVSILLSTDEDPVSVQSSFGRELAYVLSHTVHHNALIGAIVKTLGGWLPEDFGFAPSTIVHRRAQACAR